MKNILRAFAMLATVLVLSTSTVLGSASCAPVMASNGPVAVATASGSAAVTAASQQTPDEFYHKVWKLVDDNSLYRERLNNWGAWEHKYDGKLKTMAEAEKAVGDMLDSLKDPYTYFKDEKVTAARERNDAQTNVVSYRMLAGNIAYIRITTFGSQHTADEVKSALQALRGANAYIVDLRDNGGGYIHQAFAVFAMLVDEGRFTTMSGQHEGKRYAEELKVTRTELVEIVNGTTSSASREKNMTGNKPVIILVNGDTASASEMLTGALHDQGRAEAIGTKTFGKGIAQITWSLDHGTSVQITYARYYLPKGSSIHGTGITPDLVVKKSLTGDAQLDEAVDCLKGRLGK